MEDPHRILQSIESLFSRIDSLESRANQPETITDTDDDALSTMAGETSGLEFSEPLATEASFTTATSPVRASIEPIQAPVEPIQAPVAPIKAPTESNKTSDKAGNSRNLVMIMGYSTQCPSQPHGNRQPLSPCF